MTLPIMHSTTSPPLQPTQQQQQNPASSSSLETFEILADTSPGPFEGPEKLLEVWFAPSADALPEASTSAARQLPGPTRPPRRAHNNRRGSVPTQQQQQQQLVNGSDGAAAAAAAVSGEREAWRGLRTVPREVWEDMLKVVKCQVLSVIEGDQVDAYLLR